jgi:hypothetical protein
MVFRDTSLPRARRDFAHWVCLTGHPRKARSSGDAQVNLVKESIGTKLESKGSFPRGDKTMEEFCLVRFHVRCSIRAQGNLRLVIMTDEELKELARILSSKPSRPVEVVHRELKAIAKEQRRTAFRWIGALTARPFGAISKN